MHAQIPQYGDQAGRRVDEVLSLAISFDAKTVLDYGCGKGSLRKHLLIPVREYDPAIPGKDVAASPADLVVCCDVLENVEPECLGNVLAHLKALALKACYAVVHIGPARKTLPDGRNAHLIQQSPEWWEGKLSEYFTVDFKHAAIANGRGEVRFVLTHGK